MKFFEPPTNSSLYYYSDPIDIISDCPKTSLLAFHVFDDKKKKHCACKNLNRKSSLCKSPRKIKKNVSYKGGEADKKMSKTSPVNKKRFKDYCNEKDGKSRKHDSDKEDHKRKRSDYKKDDKRREYDSRKKVHEKINSKHCKEGYNGIEKYIKKKRHKEENKNRDSGNENGDRRRRRRSEKEADIKLTGQVDEDVVTNKSLAAADGKNEAVQFDKKDVAKDSIWTSFTKKIATFSVNKYVAFVGVTTKEGAIKNFHNEPTPTEVDPCKSTQIQVNLVVKPEKNVKNNYPESFSSEESAKTVTKTTTESSTSISITDESSESETESLSIQERKKSSTKCDCRENERSKRRRKRSLSRMRNSKDMRRRRFSERCKKVPKEKSESSDECPRRIYSRRRKCFKKSSGVNAYDCPEVPNSSKRAKQEARAPERVRHKQSRYESCDSNCTNVSSNSVENKNGRSIQDSRQKRRRRRWSSSRILRSRKRSNIDDKCNCESTSSNSVKEGTRPKRKTSPKKSISIDSAKCDECRVKKRHGKKKKNDCYYKCDRASSSSVKVKKKESRSHTKRKKPLKETASNVSKKSRSRKKNKDENCDCRSISSNYEDGKKRKSKLAKKTKSEELKRSKKSKARKNALIEATSVEKKKKHKSKDRPKASKSKLKKRRSDDSISINFTTLQWSDESLTSECCTSENCSKHETIEMQSHNPKGDKKGVGGVNELEACYLTYQFVEDGTCRELTPKKSNLKRAKSEVSFCSICSENSSQSSNLKNKACRQKRSFRCSKKFRKEPGKKAPKTLCAKKSSIKSKSCSELDCPTQIKAKKSSHSLTDKEAQNCDSNSRNKKGCCANRKPTTKVKNVRREPGKKSSGGLCCKRGGLNSREKSKGGPCLCQNLAEQNKYQNSDVSLKKKSSFCTNRKPSKKCTKVRREPSAKSLRSLRCKKSWNVFKRRKRTKTIICGDVDSQKGSQSSTGNLKKKGSCCSNKPSKKPTKVTRKPSKQSSSSFCCKKSSGRLEKDNKKKKDCPCKVQPAQKESKKVTREPSRKSSSSFCCKKSAGGLEKDNKNKECPCIAQKEPQICTTNVKKKSSRCSAGKPSKKFRKNPSKASLCCKKSLNVFKRKKQTKKSSFSDFDCSFKISQKECQSSTTNLKKKSSCCSNKPSKKPTKVTRKPSKQSSSSFCCKKSSGRLKKDNKNKKDCPCKVQPAQKESQISSTNVKKCSKPSKKLRKCRRDPNKKSSTFLRCGNLLGSLKIKKKSQIINCNDQTCPSKLSRAQKKSQCCISKKQSKAPKKVTKAPSKKSSGFLCCKNSGKIKDSNDCELYSPNKIKAARSCDSQKELNLRSKKKRKLCPHNKSYRKSAKVKKERSSFLCCKKSSKKIKADDGSKTKICSTKVLDKCESAPETTERGSVKIENIKSRSSPSLCGRKFLRELECRCKSVDQRESSQSILKTSYIYSSTPCEPSSSCELYPSTRRRQAKKSILFESCGKKTFRSVFKKKACRKSSSSSPFRNIRRKLKAKKERNRRIEKGQIRELLKMRCFPARNSKRCIRAASYTNKGCQCGSVAKPVKTASDLTTKSCGQSRESSICSSQESNKVNRKKPRSKASDASCSESCWKFERQHKGLNLCASNRSRGCQSKRRERKCTNGSQQRGNSKTSDSDCSGGRGPQKQLEVKNSRSKPKSKERKAKSPQAPKKRQSSTLKLSDSDCGSYKKNRRMEKNQIGPLFKMRCFPTKRANPRMKSNNGCQCGRVVSKPEKTPSEISTKSYESRESSICLSEKSSKVIKKKPRSKASDESCSESCWKFKRQHKGLNICASERSQGCQSRRRERKCANVQKRSKSKTSDSDCSGGKKQNKKQLEAKNSRSERKAKPSHPPKKRQSATLKTGSQTSDSDCGSYKKHRRMEKNQIGPLFKMRCFPRKGANPPMKSNNGCQCGRVVSKPEKTPSEISTKSYESRESSICSSQDSIKVPKKKPRSKPSDTSCRESCWKFERQHKGLNLCASDRSRGCQSKRRERKCSNSKTPTSNNRQKSKKIVSSNSAQSLSDCDSLRAGTSGRKEATRRNSKSRRSSTSSCCSSSRSKSREKSSRTSTSQSICTTDTSDSRKSSSKLCRRTGRPRSKHRGCSCSSNSKSKSEIAKRNSKKDASQQVSRESAPKTCCCRAECGEIKTPNDPGNEPRRKTSKCHESSKKIGGKHKKSRNERPHKFREVRRKRSGKKRKPISVYRFEVDRERGGRRNGKNELLDLMSMTVRSNKSISKESTSEESETRLSEFLSIEDVGIKDSSTFDDFSTDFLWVNSSSFKLEPSVATIGNKCDNKNGEEGWFQKFVKSMTKRKDANDLVENLEKNQDEIDKIQIAIEDEKKSASLKTDFCDLLTKRNVAAHSKDLENLTRKVFDNLMKDTRDLKKHQMEPKFEKTKEEKLIPLSHKTNHSNLSNQSCEKLPKTIIETVVSKWDKMQTFLHTQKQSKVLIVTNRANNSARFRSKGVVCSSKIYPMGKNRKKFKKNSVSSMSETDETESESSSRSKGAFEKNS